MDAEIRRARREDVSAVALLFDAYRRFYKEAPDPQGALAFITDRFDGDESVIFVAECDGTLAGFVQLYPIFSSTRMQRLWLLNDLFVDPAARTAGVGRALMQAAEAFAREGGACGLILETAVDNTNAQHLYESEGYVRDVHFYRYERFFDGGAYSSPSK